MTDAKYQISQGANDITITDGENEYSFHEPLGKDLIALDRLISARKASDPALAITDTEQLSLVMQVLSEDGLTADDFLSMKIALFKFLGQGVEEFFRA